MKRVYCVVLFFLLVSIAGAAERPRVAPDSSSGKKEAILVPSKKRQEIKGTFVSPGMVHGKWKKSKSPYNITGSIIVPAGQALVIEPGVDVRVVGEYATITVFGQLLARGTKENPITIRSGKTTPNPWDWDRLLIRSKKRSFMSFCTVEHSNYGAYIVNGSLSLKNCVFSRNSIHGLYAKNAEVSIDSCIFHKGHISALMLDADCEVDMDNTAITGNMNGIACSNYASLIMRNSLVEKNDVGIALRDEAYIRLKQTKVTANKTGVLSEIEIPRKDRITVYKNSENVKIDTTGNFEKIFKRPAQVSSLVFARSEQQKASKKKFQSGFSADEAPREAAIQMVGNITGSFLYYAPTSFGPDSLKQNKYISGPQPEMQVFATGRKFGMDLNILVDGHFNEWLQGTNPGGIKGNLVSMKLNSKNHETVLGDFYQGGSDISVSSRKVFGAKYTGNFVDMGRGGKKFKFLALGGETERALAVGDHNPDVPNDTIKDGLAVRQQVMGMGRLEATLVKDLIIGGKAVHSRDLGQSIFRHQLHDTDDTSNDPLQTYMGGADAQYKFGKFILRAETNIGWADSLDSNFVVKEKASDFSYANRVAGMAGVGIEMGKTIGDLQFTAIRPHYYTGGNPYLTQDQYMLEAGVSSQLPGDVEAGIDYEYIRRNASNNLAEDSSSPPQQNRVSLNGKYGVGKQLPEIGLSYTFYTEKYKKWGEETFETTVSDTDTVTGDITVSTEDSIVSRLYKPFVIKNTPGISIKQPLFFLKSSYVKISYRLDLESDRTDYIDTTALGNKDGRQHQISGILSTRHLNRIYNRFSAKAKYKSEKENNRNIRGYEVGDRVVLTILPRHLKLTLEGNYRREYDEDDETAAVYSDFRSGGGELKYNVSSKVSASVLGIYERSLDELDGSRENYRVYYGGLSITYVF